jgi:hypothetical protein
MYLKAKTTRSASTNPSKKRESARCSRPSKKKPRPSIVLRLAHLSTTFLVPSHRTLTAQNHARLTIPLPIATNTRHILLPPPNPRVPAQDSLATLAPQRQHQWLCLCLFQQPHATTRFYEQRELRRVDSTEAREQLYFQRARATALLKTRHQARAGRQSGCAHGEAQGDVSEEGSGGEGGSAV